MVIKKGKEYHRFSAAAPSCTLKDGKFSVEESIFKCAIGLSTFEVVTGKKPTPDIASLSFGGGALANGRAVQITEDRYGNFYVGADPSKGQKGLSISGGIGYINQKGMPSEDECKDFLTGPSLQGDACYGVGISGSKSITSGQTSSEIIFGAPQVTTTLYYSKYSGNPRKYIYSIFNN